MEVQMKYAYFVLCVLSVFAVGWYSRDMAVLEKDLKKAQIQRDIGKTQVQLKILESNLHPEFRATCYFMTLDFE